MGIPQSVSSKNPSKTSGRSSLPSSISSHFLRRVYYRRPPPPPPPPQERSCRHVSWWAGRNHLQGEGGGDFPLSAASGGSWRILVSPQYPYSPPSL
ncbi:hypothetical protein CEXT_203061 [Caerostris extrusa]|uniref:Uncharacterized protein n=1 Tax=Caerostris extrusa TaxID=172846 RepID=A0AAV4M8E5_CAEEX|nr:hypothetical protein CEXT_203061 [Caerostris extrusa]